MDHIIVNKDNNTFLEKVEELTGGNNFDVTVEAVGLPSTFLNCIDAAAFGGRVVVIGVAKHNADFNFTLIQKKELCILGSRNALKADFMEVIDIMKTRKSGIWIRLSQKLILSQMLRRLLKIWTKMQEAS